MSFPSLPLRYPYSRQVRVGSQVLEFLDGSEQRWQTTQVLNHFQVQLQNLSWDDLQPLRDWFDTNKGAFQEWDFTIDGETFPHMVLEGDVLALTEDQLPELFSAALTMRQTATSGTWPNVPATYPTINAGVITQRPFSSSRAYLTVRNDLPSGKRLSYAERSTPKLSWVCSYPAITTAELIPLLQFVVARGGRTKHFSFQDPETLVVYESCRIDQDGVQVEYRGPNECSTVLSVREV